MIVFVLLNLFCFILLLLKCAWADKRSWIKTTSNVMGVFAPFHPQTQLLQTENSDEESGAEENCEHCDECLSEDEAEEESDKCTSDENPLTGSSISTQTTELENTENYSGGSRQNSGSSSESDDSVVILEKNINYLEKTKEIVQSLKDELEKKND
jgi:hypothetical protein